MSVAVVVLACACGGVVDVNKGDASPKADASLEAGACPSASALSAAVGTACTHDGLSCGGDQCTDACSFCNIVQCSNGVWTQLEAFPDPSCNDAPCVYPPVSNDPQCPASYSYSSNGESCSPVGLSCAYPGQGDGTSNGCYATAMMWCKGDDASATGSWVVAQ